MAKRRIFISFDHDDAQQVSGFMGLRQIIDGFEFYNHKLDHRIRSNDPNYIGRVITDDYMRPASVTVVLIGWRTAESEWVKWEIQQSIALGNGILGIRLKDTWGPIPTGIPPEALGDWQPDKFASWIEWAHSQRRAK